MCIHLHTRAGEPGYQEMELRGVVSVPWQSDYWVSMMGEGPKEVLQAQEWEPRPFLPSPLCCFWQPAQWGLV